MFGLGRWRRTSSCDRGRSDFWRYVFSGFLPDRLFYAYDICQRPWMIHPRCSSGLMYPVLGRGRVGTSDAGYASHTFRRHGDSWNSQLPICRLTSAASNDSGPNQTAVLCVVSELATRSVPLRAFHDPVASVGRVCYRMRNPPKLGSRTTKIGDSLRRFRRHRQHKIKSWTCSVRQNRPV